MDNPNQPKPVHKTNWMVIILLIIICAVVALGIWWWQQETTRVAQLEWQLGQLQSNSDWEVYSNPDLGFSLRHPVAAKLTHETNLFSGGLVSFSGSGLSFDVTTLVANNKSLADYSYLDTAVSSETTLGDSPALVFKSATGFCGTGSCGLPFVAISTKHGDYFYNLIFSGDAVWDETEREIANSFTFVSQPTVIATPTPTPTPTATANEYAGWKTYTDEKLKIEFKYPADWKGIEEEARKCDNPAAATGSDPCEHINLLVTAFKNLQAYMAGPSIASAKSVLYEKYPVGRGGYWGDEVNKITDLNSVKNYCAKIGGTKCRVYQNTNGVTIARSVEQNCSEAGCSGEIVMYYVKLNNDIFPAMVFSTAALKDTGVVDLEVDMDKLVNSLKFI